MAHRSTPSEHTLPSRAAAKRNAAAKREADAVRLRAEAAEYDRRWAEYCAARDAQKAAERNVLAASA
jgi:hypothetical protein